MADININWKAVTIVDCDWLTISPSEGIGSQEITLSADAAQWYTKKEEAKCQIKIYDINNETNSAITCFERCIECFDCEKFIQEREKEIDYNVTTTSFSFNTNYLPNNYEGIIPNKTVDWISNIEINGNKINVSVNENDGESRTAAITVEIKLNGFPPNSFVCELSLTQKSGINNCNCSNLRFEEINCDCGNLKFEEVIGQ